MESSIQLDVEVDEQVFGRVAAEGDLAVLTNQLGGFDFLNQVRVFAAFEVFFQKHDAFAADAIVLPGLVTGGDVVKHPGLLEQNGGGGVVGYGVQIGFRVGFHGVLQASIDGLTLKQSIPGCFKIGLERGVALGHTCGTSEHSNGPVGPPWRIHTPGCGVGSEADQLDLKVIMVCIRLNALAVDADVGKTQA